MCVYRCIVIRIINTQKLLQKKEINSHFAVLQRNIHTRRHTDTCASIQQPCTSMLYILQNITYCSNHLARFLPLALFQNHSTQHLNTYAYHHVSHSKSKLKLNRCYSLSDCIYNIYIGIYVFEYRIQRHNKNANGTSILIFKYFSQSLNVSVSVSPLNAL